MGEVIIYPGNWLYNAGVVGFLRVHEEYIGNGVEFSSDGTLRISEALLNLLLQEREFGNYVLPEWFKRFVIFSYIDMQGSIEEELVRIYASKNKNKKDTFMKHLKKVAKRELPSDDDLPTLLEFLKELSDRERENFIYRRVSGLLFYGIYKNLLNLTRLESPEKVLHDLRERFIIDVSDFRPSPTGNSCLVCGLPKERTRVVDLSLNARLFPSSNEFPNSLWGEGAFICSSCFTFLMHHHLALIKVDSKTELFINAPSFKLMYHLNNYARRLYSRNSDIRKLLAMSLMEYALRFRQELHRWSTMNIEVVLMDADKIEYVSLPKRVSSLLLDYKISSLIKEIGELKVLDKVLNEEFDALNEMSYKLMREAMTSRDDRAGKSKNRYMDEFYTIREESKEDRKYQKAIELAERIAKLNALIEERV